MGITRPIARPVARPVNRAITTQRKGSATTPPTYWDIVTDRQPELYFDFYNSSTITKTGSLIDAVANLGSLGAAGNWTSATTGRPDHDATYGAAVFGSGEYLGGADLAGFNTSGSLSAFIVFERRVATAGTEVLFAQYQTTGNRKSFSIAFNASGQLLVVTSTDGSTDSTTLTITNANIDIYDINLLTWIHNSGTNTQTLRLNGNDVYDASGTAPALYNGTAAIGINLINGTAAGNFQGALYTLAAYNSALSDADRDLVEGFLANKIDSQTYLYVEGAP